MNRVRHVLLIGTATMCASLQSQPAFAGAAVPVTAAFSTVSLGVTTTAVVGGAATMVLSTSWWSKLGGAVVTGGGLLLGTVDPPSGTFFSGDFTFHYDPSLLALTQSGWLGDWGVDPTFVAPPADPTTWFAGLVVELQAPNAALAATSSNDPVAGLQQVSFDWGPAGHPTPGADPFNFFSSVFEAKQSLRIEYLGSSDSPLPGANFYVSSTGTYCRPPSIDRIQLCGEAETQYFKVSSVPEPASWMLMIGGFGIAGAAVRRRRYAGVDRSVAGT